MKWLLPILFLFTLCKGFEIAPVMGVPMQGRGETIFLEKKSGGLNRQCVVYIPPSYDGKKRVPLILALHGSGSIAQYFLQETELTLKADKEGFIIAFPQASWPRPEEPADILKNPPVWNDGSGRAHAGDNNIDDLKFLEGLLDHLQDTYLVDKSRIYVIGFSNGASMSARLMNHLSDQVAALAMVTGNWYDRVDEFANQFSMLYILGSKDPVFPQNGGEVNLPYGAKAKNDPPKDTVKALRQAMGCSFFSRTKAERDGVRVTKYNCKSKTEVQFILMENVGHVWPGGPKDPQRNRFNGYATNKIWDFFQAHPKSEVKTLWPFD